MNRIDYSHNDHPQVIEWLDYILGPGMGLRVLKLCSAPPKLAYLSAELNQFRDLLLRLTAQDAERKLLTLLGLPSDITDRLEIAAKDVVTIRKLVGASGPWRMVRVAAEMRHPLLGLVTGACPVWSSLFLSTEAMEKPEAEAQFRLVADAVNWSTLVLMSKVNDHDYESFIGEWSRLKQYSNLDRPSAHWRLHASRIQNAHVGLRDLTSRAHVPLLAAIGDESDGHADVIDNVLLMSDEELAESNPTLYLPIIRNLRLLFEAARGLSTPVQRRRGAGHRFGGGPLRDGFVRYESALGREGFEDGIGPHQWVSPAPKTPDIEQPDYDEAEELEDIPEPSVLLVDPDPDEPNLRAGLSHAVLNHLDLRQQLLPDTWYSLTAFEISKIVEGISRADALLLGEISLRMYLCMAMAVATGHRFESAAKIVIGNDPEVDAGHPIAFCRRRCAFVVWVRGPAYRKERAVHSNNERAVDPVLVLPAPKAIIKLVDALSTDIDGPVLKRVTAQLVNQAKHRLHLLTDDDRVGLAALQTALRKTLLEECRGDVGLFGLLIDNNGLHSRTTGYYSTVQAKQSADLWARCQTRIWGEPVAAMPLLGSTNSIGSRQCPTIDAIRTLMGNLRRRINPYKVSDIHRYHNDFVYHAIAVLTLALGCRPSRRYRLHQVDAGTGLATYVDKLSSEEHRRVGYLVQIARQQLRYLELHYQLFALPLLQRIATSGRIRTLGMFFVFDEKGNPFPFQPLHFSQATRESFGLPLYSLRRFLRTHLIYTAGAPPEVVDVLMGHWHGALAPFSGYSTFSVTQLKAVSDQYIEPMLRELGVSAAQSRLIAHV